MLLDSNSGIDYGYLQVIFIFILFFDYANFYFNFTMLGELKGVWLETKEHLHDSMFVSGDHRRIKEILIILCVILSLNICESWKELDFLIKSFLTLNAHYFFDRVNNIKCCDVSSELAGFDLSIIKQILNNKAHQTTGTFLHFQSFV